MNNRQQLSPLSLPHKIKNIVAGSFHSIAIADEGIWIWGKSQYCNLGFRAKEQFRTQPQFINVKVQNASAGNQHSFAWKGNEVYCWGYNRDCKLGFEKLQEYPITKSQIFSEAIEAGMKLNQISCGESHSLAVFKVQQENQNKHQIFAWGESNNYQLALQTQGIVEQPIMIQFNQSVKNIYSKDDYNFVVTNKGDCYSWGSNLFGRLGFNNNIKNLKYPMQIKLLIKIISIAMGKYHCIAITQNYQGYSWGHGIHGQLGLDQIKSQVLPTKIQYLEKVIQAACGECHSLILSEKLELMSCGNSVYNALGHNEIDLKKRCKKFKKVNWKFGKQIVKIVSGNRHNLVMTKDGKVYSWGCNKYGQLGRNTEQLHQQSIIKRQLSKQPTEILLPKKPLPPDPSQKFQVQQRCENEQQYQNIQKNEQKLSKQHLLQNWKKRYQKFKKQQDKIQKQFMNQLNDIFKNKFL